MKSCEEYILVITVISVSLQIFQFIINNDNLVSIYKFVSGVILISVILVPASSLIDINDILRKDYMEESNFESYKITSVFSQKINDAIRNDIKNNFNIDCKVKISTDLSGLKIYIYGDIPKYIINNLDEFVTEKYCTEHDEVIISEYD